MCKAIAVVDMPDCCEYCDMSHLDPWAETHICCLTEDDVEFPYDGKWKLERKENCPLKPVPKQVGSASEYTSDDMYVKELIKWKKQVEEIIGEKGEECYE